MIKVCKVQKRFPVLINNSSECRKSPATERLVSYNIFSTARVPCLSTLDHMDNVRGKPNYPRSFKLRAMLSEFQCLTQGSVIELI